ncbi:S-layer homology domain-containing protein [Tepidimicrobium xylanilyticum]|uniref:S-layer homology domain-containing protein n=1 Tax=Tepidimicrobium xylanilyticum TaxID=1123352 RepID=A0A1H2W8M5_9FIRM|nr:S-layer homology domain-containing protein [Tepidimicrobium xylanilyticum]SDW76992.1 S-layer homology domain-containing protein [Tepidimicrobium xylanilyticum]
MKRKLSLLLAVVMILSSFSFVFADEEVNVPAFLEKNGILKGDKSGNLMLDKALERRDAVVLLSRLLKAEEEAKNYEPAEDEIYPDNNDPYYAGFLGWATANGYFEGYPNGNFKPRESILVQEFALVLLRALEYGDTEWKSVMDKAKELGILEGVKEADANAAIVREDVATMIFNALGVKMKKEGKTLAEFLGIEMPAPKELKATVNDTENLKEIKVELSNAKLANEEKLLNTSNYRLEGNVIERAELKGNDLLLEVRDTLRSGKEYQLEIKNVDKAINGKYKFVARDNTIPSVEKVEVLGEYGIKVITSEPIEDVRGKNFLVDGKYIVMNVERYGRNLILTPYSGSFPSGAKTLTIEGLVDFAGYKSAKEDFDIEIVKDNEAPKVVDAILKGNKVEVVFDKDIYKPSVAEYYSKSDTGNISYELGRHTIYADSATKVDTNKVVYEFKDNEAPSRRDEVTIVDIENHSRVKMEKTTIALREVLDDIEPEIIKKEIVSKTFDSKTGTATIRLHFNKEVKGSFVNDKSEKTQEEEGFIVKDHFALYEDEVSKRTKLDGENDPKITSAKYYYNVKEKRYEKDVIDVVIEGLKIWDNKDNDIEYILEIEGFTDMSSSRNKMYRDYYSFEFTKSSDFIVKSVKVYEGTRTRDTEIEIEFNKKLDRSMAEDGTNYIFYTQGDKNDIKTRVLRKDVDDLNGEAILKSNGYVVLLEIPLDWDDLTVVNKYFGLKIENTLKTTSGQRLDASYYYEFESKELLKEGQTVAEKESEKQAKDAAENVVELINKLPKVEEITLANKDAVKEAETAYNNLSDEAKKFVSDEAKDKLDKAVEKIKELEGKDEAEKVKAINEAQTLEELWDALRAAGLENLRFGLIAEYDAALAGTEETLAEIQEVIDRVNSEADLEAAKEAAKDELDEYKDAADYTVNAADLATAIATGKAAIDAATTTEEVDTALADAKAAIDEIESDTEMVARVKKQVEELNLTWNTDADTTLNNVNAAIAGMDGVSAAKSDDDSKVIITIQFGSASDTIEITA